MKKILCILVSVLFVLSCVPVMATDKAISQNVPMSTFSEVNAMFPEAKLTDPAENPLLNAYKKEPVCFSDDAVAEKTYKKEVDGDVHYLEVFADGSYVVYGIIDDEAVSTVRDNYTYYNSQRAYYSIMSGISMAFYYDYNINNSTGIHDITDARNASTTNSNSTYDAEFYNTRLVSNVHAYRIADVANINSGNVTVYTVGVRLTDNRRDIYLYRD